MPVSVLKGLVDMICARCCKRVASQHNTEGEHEYISREMWRLLWKNVNKKVHHHHHYHHHYFSNVYVTKCSSLSQYFSAQMIKGPTTQACLDVLAGRQYSIKVRAKPNGNKYSGFWSDWSDELTGGTPTDTGKLLLRIINTFQKNQNHLLVPQQGLC